MHYTDRMAWYPYNLPFDDGYDAFFIGYKVTDVPANWGIQSQEDWVEGWLAAEDFAAYCDEHDIRGTASRYENV